MTEEYFNRVKNKLRDYYPISRLEFEGGDRTYIAGQKDIISEKYRLYLRSDITAEIEEEKETSRESHSETLDGIMNHLELELNALPMEYETGSIYVEVEYDNYPGGSF